MTKQQIEHFMRAAMQEGQKALPACRPNPPVGCVIVKDGKIVSSGYTNPPGEAHAERMALNDLPTGITDFTLFVTLEPCSFQGRTPSCAKHIMTTSCKTVYVGMIDPHIRNQGKGIELLQSVGIDVRVGILEKEVRAQLGPYLLHPG
ncbi:MAG: bifunctional diaminohydroxyphosphoribosylaminopyrimidine deaminase/5-amino-6-(5-phosphoribosylamino)uracil reductase RibD [Bacteroidota bacterium]